MMAKSTKRSSEFPERPTGVGAPEQVQPPVIPASPLMPVDATPPAVPLAEAPADGQDVLIDGKVRGTARRAHDKGGLIAVESAAHSKGCPICRYALERLYPASRMP